MTSLRRRILLAITLPAIGILALSCVFVYTSTQTRERAHVDRGLEVRAAAMAALVDLDGGVWDVEFDRTDLPVTELFGGLAAYEVRVATNGGLLAQRRLDGAEPFAADAPYAPPDLSALPSDRPLELEGRHETVALADGRELRTWTGVYLVRAHAGDPGEGARVPVGAAAGPTAPLLRISVAQDVSHVHQDLRALLGVQIASGLALSAVALGAGWLLSRRIVAPIDAIARRAAEVHAPSATPPLAPLGTGDEIDRLVDALNQSYLRLNEAYTLQERFTADASHELRTPLAVIRANAELALRQPRSADALRDVLADVLSGALRAEAVVQGLLTLARADAGGPDTAAEEVDVESLAREIVDEVGGEAAGAPRLRVEASGDTRVGADALQLEVVVRNLLDNALRHTPTDGEVVVTVRGGPAGVEIAVRDTGAGIPEDALPHVFERFYRVDEGRSRGGGGAGLGLSIVRALAARHGGAVGIESRVGEGTTVRVNIPRTNRRVA